MIVENKAILIEFNDEEASIVKITNKMTDEVYLIFERGIEIEASDFKLDFDGAAPQEITVEENEVKAAYSNEHLKMFVSYKLKEAGHYLEKKIRIIPEHDFGLKKVIMGKLTFSEDQFKVFEYKYPDFDIIEQKVEINHGWNIKRKPDTQPCRTFFGRTESGGFFSGMELSFDSSSYSSNEICFACLPNMKLNSGEIIDLEPLYIGVYKRNRKDINEKKWKPEEELLFYEGRINISENAYIAKRDKTEKKGSQKSNKDLADFSSKSNKISPLPSESEAMLRLTEGVLGRREKEELVAAAVGWHSQLETREYTKDSVEADIKALELLKDCSINWLGEPHPWGGETNKINDLTEIEEYDPGPLLSQFLNAADKLDINVVQWSTLNNTNPWMNGTPFRIDKPEWLRDVGDHKFCWPNEFKGASGNCVANKPFAEWMMDLFRIVVQKGGYKGWVLDGDFWGTGGYFNSTVPVECYSKEHDHIKGDSNYSTQRSLQNWIDTMKDYYPDKCVMMCRPVQDLGVWALRNVDMTFTLIETGTGYSNLKGGDEIRTASRIRVNHHFIPNYLDCSLLFPSYSDTEHQPVWNSDNLDYIIISALSCSPNMFVYLPLRSGIPEKSKIEIKRWLDWGRDNIRFLFVRKDLPDWPGKGHIDGSAHIKDREGIIFLFNSNEEIHEINLELTNDYIGISDQGNYTIRMEYPNNNKTVNKKYGESVKWEVLPKSVAILRINQV